MGECWKDNHHPKPKSQSQENAADDLGHAVSGLIDKAVKKFPEQMMVCPEAKGGHFEHSQWLQNLEVLLLLLHDDVILLCVCSNAFESAKITTLQCC